MASLIESEAVFSSRLRTCGLQAYEAAFGARGWKTLSTFAFASSWAPGSGDDTAFVNQVLRPLGIGADHADTPKIRKLYFEAFTMVAADLRSKLETGPDSDGQKVKKLAPVERKARWEDIKRRYPHMSLTEQLEPAHHVIDKFHSMKSDGELKYVAAHEVPTRDQEMLNVKTEELIKRDASGHLRAHDETKVPEADVKTDLRMRQAFTRRGIALELADVMTFTVHEALVDKMFQEYQREPPPGYAAVTLRQIAEADRRIWKLTAEKLNGDLGRDGTGARIVDEKMKEAMVDPAFLTMLLPLPGRSQAGSSTEKGEEVEQGAGKRKLRRENAMLKEKLKATQNAESKKTKVTPEVKKMPVKMPKELWGLHPMKHKERICYGYEMKTCKKEGDSCDRGLHICMKCWKKDHGALDCSK